MASKAVNVYRFEYEILPSFSQWSAYIAAFTPDEAEAHLAKTVNQPLKVSATTHVCRLDDLSAEIRANVISAFLAGQGQAAKTKKSVESAETKKALESATPPNKKLLGKR